MEGSKTQHDGSYKPGLKTQAKQVAASLLDQETLKHGKLSSKITPNLNPLFVEWLMGLPIGWSDLKPLEMGSFQAWWLSFSGE